MLPRQKIINKFNTILNDTTNAELIETSIFNYTNEQIQQLNLLDDDPFIIEIYMEKARSLYDNLNPESYFNNKELLNKFNKIDIQNIANINIHTFRKNLWKPIKQKQEILDKNLIGLKPTAETDQFLCKKCRERKTTFYTMQIRSADEPETSFITCLNCNYSWREG